MSIYQKILNVCSKVDRVPKNGRNDFHKYNYATEADILEAVRGLLVEEGLVVIPSCKEYEADGDLRRVRMTFTFFDVETGESFQAEWLGEGQDKGDKGFYKAFTGAQKYCFTKTFHIPTGDDPEQDQPKSRPQAQARPRTPAKPKPEQPAPDDASDPVAVVAATLGGEVVEEFTEGEADTARKALFAALDEYAKKRNLSKEQAKGKLDTVMKDRYGVFTTKKLTPAQMGDLTKGLKEAK
ncbi:MAG: ERF family protein [Minisyncoccota bacterium]